MTTIWGRIYLGILSATWQLQALNLDYFLVSFLVILFSDLASNLTINHTRCPASNFHCPVLKYFLLSNMLLSRFIQKTTPRTTSIILKQQQRSFSATTPAMTLISQTIKNDHRELEEAYNKILSSSTDDEKVRWQNQFTWELARHSIGEELLVYPAFEKNLADGKQMADKDRAEHQKVPPLFALCYDLYAKYIICIGEGAPL